MRRANATSPWQNACSLSGRIYNQKPMDFGSIYDQLQVFSGSIYNQITVILVVKRYGQGKIRLALYSVVGQAGDGRKAFSYTKIERGRSRARDYMPAVEWLVKAQIIYPSSSLTRVDIPLSMYTEEGTSRFYLYDIGMFFSMVSNNSTLLRNTILADNWKGAAKGTFYEVLTADLLHMTGHELYKSCRKKT